LFSGDQGGNQGKDIFRNGRFGKIDEGKFEIARNYLTQLLVGDDAFFQQGFFEGGTGAFDVIESGGNFGGVG